VYRDNHPLTRSETRPAELGMIDLLGLSNTGIGRPSVISFAKSTSILASLASGFGS